MITLKYLVLGLTYSGFGWGYLPGLRMNRAAIAIVGQMSAMVLRILDLETALWAIDFQYDRLLAENGDLHSVDS